MFRLWSESADLLYKLYIKAVNTDSSAVPATLAGVMAHALEYLRGAIEVNPSLSKVLDHSMKAYVAYSVEELNDGVGNSPSFFFLFIVFTTSYVFPVFSPFLCPQVSAVPQTIP